MILLQFFIKLILDNLFLHQSYFKNPLPAKINLIKNAKNRFLMIEKM